MHNYAIKVSGEGVLHTSPDRIYTNCGLHGEEINGYVYEKDTLERAVLYMVCEDCIHDYICTWKK